MKYLSDIRDGRDDPRRLEDLYRAARSDSERDEFKADMLACYAESPDNVLYAAWRYRLESPPVSGPGVNWLLAIGLGLMAGLVFGVLSSSRFDLPDYVPYLLLGWAPLGALFVIAFLAGASKEWKQSWLPVVGLLIVGVYVTALALSLERETYRTLMVLHMPLIALAGVALHVLGARSDAQNRFAFLLKTIEVGVTGGVYVIVGGMFAGITIGLFAALGVRIPVDLQKFLVAGGGGAIIVLAVATVYDPRVGPAAQRFGQGLGKLVPTMMRLLLPLTLLVLIVYLFFIPFNFMQPFRNRDILIVYNAMLFAVMGLLIGVTPMQKQDLPERYHGALRAGVLAVASLTLLVSLYALSATVYRTALGGLTLNRLTVIGWNTINIGILALLIYKQLKHGAVEWISSLQSTFSAGTIAYVVWALFLALATPWLPG